MSSQEKDNTTRVGSYLDPSSPEYDDFVNGIKRLSSAKEKLKAIQAALTPIARHFYNGAPQEIKIPKREMAALYVLVVNNKNWEHSGAMKTDEDIRKFLLKLIDHIDYDIAKSYDPELSEDPEYMEADMQRMIGMVREFIDEDALDNSA